MQRIIPLLRDSHPLGRRVVRAMSVYLIRDRARIPKPNDVGVIYEYWYNLREIHGFYVKPSRLCFYLDGCVIYDAPYWDKISHEL